MRIIRRIKMLFLEHWIKIVIIAVVLLLLVLSVVGLMTLESFYRHLTLATLPLTVLTVALNAIIFVYFYLIFLRGGFAQIRKKTIRGEDVDVHFSDVIGIDEAKEESFEVVQLIKDRVKLQKIGGKIMRGILMIGPPGCGKTYLAKAIATEADMPFLSMSAAEFVEIFVGVGASRVRKLFQRARRLAYGHGGCIVFIDELDAIGRRRVFSVFGGTEETNSTQNQLLAEMDGLQGRAENVIVIGATNALEDVLDQALLRPGRFDRKIYIDKPGLEGREKLFQYYLNTVKYDKSVDIGKLARKSVYKTPADIMNIVKEAALIATRNKKDIVEYKDLTEAIERIDLGIKHKKKMTPREREMIAFHETGHLVTMYLTHPTEDVFKASIISHGAALGVVHPSAKDEFFTHSKDALLADIRVSLSGYTAEKIKFAVTSDGVSSDFKQAMKIAHLMVWRYGMGESGFVGDYTAIPESELSEEIKQKLNMETQHLLQRCCKEVEELLKKEWQIVERFVKELLEKDELEFDEIEAIFKDYGKSHAPLASE